MVIKVKPKASAGSQSVVTGSTSTWAVPALGTGLGVTITGAPSAGTASASGANMTYVAPSTASTQTIKYKVTDASGLVSDEATITVTVTVPTPPTITDITSEVWATPVSTTQDLDVMGLLGLTPKSAYSVTPVLPVSVKAGSNSFGTPTQSPAKTEINWVSSTAAQYNQVGVYEIEYPVSRAPARSPRRRS